MNSDTTSTDLRSPGRPRPSARRTIAERSDAQAASRLRALGLHKSYRKGPIEIPVLRGIDLSVRSGELLAVVGQSGSGKSTLLHLLATLDAPDRGEIHFDGERIDNVSARRRERFRNQTIGMIFQFYHLLPELSALENVLVPRMIADSFLRYRRRRKEYRERAEWLLDLVGLSHRRHHRPAEMSGGEMQRAAIARALIAEPQLLLADEPTGNLDRKNGQAILELLQSLNDSQELTIVMVTHDLSVTQLVDRVVRLTDGRVQAQ